MKRIIKFFSIIFISIFIVSCGSKEYELPNLEDKTRTEIISEFAAIDSEIIVNFEYELAKGLPEGVFVKYKNNLKYGDKVDKEKEINVVLAKDKFRLPNLNLKTKTEIEQIFAPLFDEHKELNLTLEFKYELNEDLAEDLFVKYETLQVGSILEEDQVISIVLSGPKYHLPNLTGKNKEEIEQIFEDSLVGFDYLDFELQFSYEFADNIDEGIFVKYEELKADDFIYESQKISIVLSSLKYRLPNLEGKSVEEAATIIGQLNDEFDDIEVELEYQYVYRSNLERNTFIGYGDDYKENDIIKTDTTIVLVFSEVYYYPSIDEMDRTTVNAHFNAINDDFDEANLLVNYKFVYDETKELGTIVGYEDEIEGEPIVFNSIINILVTTYQKAPDLQGKNEQEITSLFNTYKQAYNDFQLELNFIYKYNTVPANTFYKYDDLIEVDLPLPNEGTIDIYLSKHSFELPDFDNYTRYEIENYFNELNIPLDKIDFRAMPGYDVPASTFIKYNNAEIGELFDFSKSTKLIVLHDNAIILPNLEGLNKHQIIRDLDRLGIRRLSFEYIINESKEYDTFSHYYDKQAGDSIYASDDILIYLYMNVFVNTDEWGIINEKELFISKYIDGATNGQGIELYNATDDVINLADFYIAILSSGSYEPTYIVELEGMLAPNKTFVIMNDKSSEAFLAKADLITDDMKFGGNDTIQLRKSSNHTYTDIIYEVGNINILMDKEIFVRRDGITHGRRNYIYREWMGFVPDFDEIIGVHPATGYADPVFELIEDKTFQEYGMTKVRYIRAADGDTVYFESLDPRDPTSYNGDSRVRFLLVNTPEIGEPYKLAAQRFTENMLENASEIYIQSSYEAGLTETYGRHLGLVWANTGTVANPNWKLLNYELLKAGLGIIMIAKTGQYQNHPIFGGRYLYQWAADADAYAKENNLGLYSGINQPQ